jgi:hypothetical protein
MFSLELQNAYFDLKNEFQKNLSAFFLTIVGQLRCILDAFFWYKNAFLKLKLHK